MLSFICSIDSSCTSSFHSLILQLVDPAGVKNEAERIASDGDKFR